MSPFIIQFLTEFTCPLPKDDLAEECLAAEEAILKFRDTGEGTPGIVPGLEHVEVNAEEIAALSAALRSFVVAQPTHACVGSAIWAMSKLNDDQLAPFYIEQIRLHYAARRQHPVSQADYALCRLGYDVPHDYWLEEHGAEGYWLAVEQFLANH